ncbi:MAG: hypothetical protein WA908_04675 [Pontixanthobacter sp.]
MTDRTTPFTFETPATNKTRTYTKRKHRAGPGVRLRNALTALANGHGHIERHHEKAWASITFVGARHTMRLVFDGADAVAAGEIFLVDLPDHEFTLPGQLVADATISSVEHRMLPEPHMVVDCEILVLDDE